MIRQTALLILMFLATVITCQANDITVKSPNGALSVTINNNGGKASYSVALNGKTVLNQSALGLMTSLGDLTQGLTLADSRTSKVELHYDMKKTKASHSDYFANELTAVFKNNQKQVLEVTFRVSDNDVAFRYNISIEHPDREPDLQRLLILSEASSFNFPDNTTTYLCPMAAPGILWAHARPSYEEVYTPDAPMDVKSQFDHGYSFPCLFRQQDTWVLVSETGTTGAYCGTHLSDYEVGKGYTIAFPD
ncbi:MAG: glycoside hydrolase family 97 N-terminal domain-containing protein, partial [Bacteroidales bacterium]|nr:glycoside hydrolase family 97 N-terminal domain-containing protein [Bacteroidales bacterium]